MQPHKPTEPIADRPCTPLIYRGLVCLGLLLHGCSSSSKSDSDEGAQVLPDLPPDLPSELAEYEGILHGTEFNTNPTHFWECDSGEQFEMTYGDWDHVWEGSCYGVYQRVRGQLDRSFDPPRLLVHETLEERWSTSSDCSFFHEPNYESCAIEDNPDSEFPKWICLPTQACPHDFTRCTPVRFDSATEFNGWKTFDCIDMPEPAMAGPLGVCEYSGDTDNCLETYRCWNQAGDLTEPGVCVHYCDLNDAADPCAAIGTCVRCSSSDRWGLCMTDCSGEDCNVDAFC